MTDYTTNNAALDVRILQVAEKLSDDAVTLSALDFNVWAKHTSEAADTLRAIAAELRAAPTPARTTTVDTIMALFAGARSEVDLRETWADVAPSLPALDVSERLRVMEGFNTRMCAVCRDDG